MNTPLQKIFTVSQLNDNIKFVVEETFGVIWVEGEVSNLRRPQSGHTYFTLKDDKSQVRAVFFRQFGWVKNRPADFDLEEGLNILCRARLSVYPPRGEYQLIVEAVEPRGLGALQKAFEQLKAQLAAEGLFDERYKKSIPFLPSRIGIVTSPTGAVIKDILHITRRRFPSVDILLAPSRVQGAEAAGEIIRGLQNLHTAGVDVIIIARGGGSLEDMAPFNNEALARAIFRSPVPIVSAIGHETDFTICDFVADLRAPTPSAAAELAVPDAAELKARVGALQLRLIDSGNRLIASQRKCLINLQGRLKDPARILIDQQIQLDDLRERTQRAWLRQSQSLSGKIQQLGTDLRHQSPAGLIAEKRFLLNNYQKDILKNYNSLIELRNEHLQKNLAVLNSLNPLSVLQRGYSITRSLASGAVIREAAQLHCAETVDVKLAKGHFQAKVEKLF